MVIICDLLDPKKLDESKFNEPMPWIGLYIASASLICAVAMALDALHGFRYRKFWFPCKFFRINATTLTIISAAVKLSVDLNTSMPNLAEQLAKLSSNAFLCTVIGNSLPSLGTMESGGMTANVVALGILVITVIVNVCIQLGTGVIRLFRLEQVALLVLMMVLFALLVSSSLAIPMTKHYLDRKYQQKYVIAIEECDTSAFNNNNTSLTQILRDHLTRYWMMAHTCNPQFVLGRSATCTASGAFCLLSMLILAEGVTRGYLKLLYNWDCSEISGYKWSTPVVYLSQGVAVVMGTIAPASRWFMAIKFQGPKRSKKKSLLFDVTNVELYWIKKLSQLKERPLESQIHGKQLVYVMIDKSLDLCILVQKGMVVLSKFARLISIFILRNLLLIRVGCKKLADLIRCNNINNTIPGINMRPEPTRIDLANYVLHLQGEEELIDLMVERHHDATDHWIKMGRKRQPKRLISELEKLNPAREFEGLKTFDSNEVLSLHLKELPNNWSLPIVTLTSIAVAISSDDFNLAQELIKLVNEATTYIGVVENNLNVEKDLIRVTQTADVVWAKVSLQHRWLGLDLRDISCKGKSPKEVISQLLVTAKKKFDDVRNTEAFASSVDDPLNWPLESVAANSMYRICETLLLDEDEQSSACSKVVLEKIKSMIVDITGACLTNLKDAILMKCRKSSIEHREEDVTEAIILLGKTEKIIEILSAVEMLPCSDREVLACIDKWRALVVKNDKPSSNDFSCASNDQNSGFKESSSSDLHLDIECVEDLK